MVLYGITFTVLVGKTNTYTGVMCVYVTPGSHSVHQTCHPGISSL